MLQHHGWRLDVSQHGTGSSYMKAFSEVLDMLTLWEAMYPGLRIRVRDSFPGWRQQYKTQEGKPKPFDSDPAAAHRICLQRTCHQLYNGRLWKCPALAYFDQIAERTGITGDPDWAPFAGYQGILPDAPEAALAEFANGQPIAACACCPARVIEYHIVTLRCRWCNDHAARCLDAAEIPPGTNPVVDEQKPIHGRCCWTR